MVEKEKNIILTLKKVGVLIEGDENLQRHATKYYKELFGTEPSYKELFGPAD